MDSSDLGLNFPRMDVNSLRLIFYADASYASNADSTFQIDHIAVLMDEHDNSVHLSFRSSRSKRATRSVLDTEAIALFEVFDVGYCLAQELRDLAKQSVPLLLVTDAQTLFHAFIKGAATVQ
jgi:hypothetical protein